MTNSKFFSLAAACAALILSSCAHRGDLKPSAAVTAPAASPEQKAEAPKAELKHYIVAKGDCLWTIAAKPSVLGDAFHWPLLYKQNRDEIQDPDIIEPAQDLSYHSSYSAADLNLAQKQAEEMPAYVPHSTPAVYQKIKD